MALKRIFVLNGHPGETSLSRHLAEAYAKKARNAGHDVRMVHLSELTFDMDYGAGGYTSHKPLEPQIEAVLLNIEWCEHMVLTTPMWWGGLPAKLKGLIDRTFLPGRTFDTRSKIPKPMLKGRTARVFLTSDTPSWYFRLFLRNALIWQLKRQVLGFIGLKTKVTNFASATHPKPRQVEAWRKQVEGLAPRAG